MRSVHVLIACRNEVMNETEKLEIFIENKEKRIVSEFPGRIPNALAIKALCPR